MIFGKFFGILDKKEKGGCGMSKIAVFFAEGFEEIEALTVVDLCRRAGIDTEMVSADAQDAVTGAHGICIKTDKILQEVEFEKVDMIVLPGGWPGTPNLEAQEGLMKQVDEFNRCGKMIGAICAAPSILGHRGLLEGKKACSFPGFEEQLTGAQVTKNKVEKDGNIITSRGMGTAFDFGLTIVEHFCGKEKRDELAKTTIYVD